MTACKGRVLAQRADDVVRLHISGHVTAHHCPAIRQFVDVQLGQGASRIRCELAECTWFDSTFLGTLLGLSRHPRLKQGDFQLCSPSAACQQILKQMAVQGLFRVCEDSPATSFDGWQELSDTLDPHDTLPFKENVVRAHQELAAVPGPLSGRFQAIVDVASQELEEARGRCTK